MLLIFSVVVRGPSGTMHTRAPAQGSRTLSTPPKLAPAGCLAVRGRPTAPRGSRGDRTRAPHPRCRSPGRYPRGNTSPLLRPHPPSPGASGALKCPSAFPYESHLRAAPPRAIFFKQIIRFLCTGTAAPRALCSAHCSPPRLAGPGLCSEHALRPTFFSDRAGY